MENEAPQPSPPQTTFLPSNVDALFRGMVMLRVGQIVHLAPVCQEIKAMV